MTGEPKQAVVPDGGQPAARGDSRAGTSGDLLGTRKYLTPGTPAMGVSLEQARILVVDSRPARRIALRDRLEQAGYAAHPAADAAEALAWLRGQGADLVVCELSAPGLDGLELARRIRSEPGLHTLRLVLWSADPADGDIERLLDALGGARYIGRPLEPEALLDAAAALLREADPAPVPEATLVMLEAMRLRLRLRGQAGTEDRTLRERRRQPVVPAAGNGTDAIDAEQALRDNRARLALALKAGRSGTFHWDVGSGEMRWSDELLALYGIRRETLGGRFEDWLDCLVAEDRAAGRAAAERAIESGGFALDFRIRRRDTGELRWMAGQGEVFYDQAGRPQRLVGINIDITERKLADEALRRERAQFQAILDHSPLLISIKDVNSNLVLANRAIYEVFDWPPPEQAIGLSVFALFPARIAETIWANDLKALASNGPIRTEETIRHKDGSWHTYLTSKFPLRNADADAPWGICTIATDITKNKQMEEELRESEARFHSMADSAPAILWVAEADGTVSFISQAWYDYTGQAPSGGLGLGWLDAVHPDERDGVLQRFREHNAWQMPFEDEYRLLRGDGIYRWVVNSGRPRFSAEGGYLGYIGSVMDIHERKEAQIRVHEAALHDPLTGLPNRAFVFEYGSHLLAAAERGQHGAALLFIDLDRFKPINDQYGHEVGDRVLQEVGKRLIRCIRQEDLAGRLGGDEFVILLSCSGSGRERAAVVAQHVIDSIGQPYFVGPHQLSVTPSIGISCFPDHGADVDGLIHAADLGMYRAKREGRAGYCFYSHDLDGD